MVVDEERAAGAGPWIEVPPELVKDLYDPGLVVITHGYVGPDRRLQGGARAAPSAPAFSRSTTAHRSGSHALVTVVAMVVTVLCVVPLTLIASHPTAAGLVRRVGPRTGTTGRIERSRPTCRPTPSGAAYPGGSARAPGSARPVSPRRLRLRPPPPHAVGPCRAAFSRRAAGASRPQTIGGPDGPLSRRSGTCSVANGGYRSTGERTGVGLLQLGGKPADLPTWSRCCRTMRPPPP